jgi:ADP-heptose:LPS heptosyltransferase
MMKTQWQNCKNILCIRADNLGDVLMSSPAIRALKLSTGARITVLTSSMGALITPYVDCIDDVIVFDSPFVKTSTEDGPGLVNELIEKLKRQRFDAAVIFTVCSQNPLPAAFIAYMAEIPLRLAYCRENPYALLTDWLPDDEPYSQMRHQVERDFHLVRYIGASVEDQDITIVIPADASDELHTTLAKNGISLAERCIVLHPGVSEEKRLFDEDVWAQAAGVIASDHQATIFITGTSSERPLAERLQSKIGDRAICVAGMLPIAQFIALLNSAELILSVNTGTIHIAAALKKPVVVLYAKTNPQHTPWNCPSEVLYFDVREELKSRNEVLRYIAQQWINNQRYPVAATDIIDAANKLLVHRSPDSSPVPSPYQYQDS